MNKADFLGNMRKALAQNPNLLRTLIGLGLTLIFLLAYAVYGATINTEVYLYESQSLETAVDLGDSERYYDSEGNQTTWTWDANINGINLTWVNLTATSLSSGSTIAISNGNGLYSHPDLGNPDATDFSCSESCKKRIEHKINSTGDSTSIISLTDPDPSIRGKGSVFADSEEEATSKASRIVNNTFEPTKVRITVIEQGNRSVNPAIELTQVNEELYNVEMFEVDAATEFLWALAAVIGCFSMVLVPSFTVYFAARAKQRKTDLKLQSARKNIEEE
tara:strand:- start:1253 stop:2083 length:831 start_codon:yes stop_codon:yes gene_type:complete